MIENGAAVLMEMNGIGRKERGKKEGKSRGEILLGGPELPLVRGGGEDQSAG